MSNPSKSSTYESTRRFNVSELLDWRKDTREMADRVLLGTLLAHAEEVRTLNGTWQSLQLHKDMFQKEYDNHSNQEHGLSLLRKIKNLTHDQELIEKEIINHTSNLCKQLPSHWNMHRLAVNGLTAFTLTTTSRASSGEYTITTMPFAALCEQGEAETHFNRTMMFTKSSFETMLDALASNDFQSYDVEMTGTVYDASMSQSKGFLDDVAENDKEHLKRRNATLRKYALNQLVSNMNDDDVRMDDADWMSHSLSPSTDNNSDYEGVWEPRMDDAENEEENDQETRDAAPLQD